MLTLHDVLSHFPPAQLHGSRYRTVCPVHGDSPEHPSLQITEGRDRVLFACMTKQCAVGDIIKAAGLSWSDVLPDRGPNGSSIAATYDYTDADGVLRYQTVRLEPKGFRQRKPDGAGGWTWKLEDVERLPYRLHEFKGHKVAWLCFSPDTEVLTPNGWVAIPQLALDDKVAEFDCGTIRFVSPIARQQFKYSGELVSISANWCDLLVTPDHRMLVRRGSKNGVYGRWKVKPAGELGVQWLIPVSGRLEETATSDSPTVAQARLMAAYMADGCMERGRRRSWTAKKQRKIDRLAELLASAGIKFRQAPIAAAPGWTQTVIWSTDAPWLEIFAPKREMTWRLLSWNYAARAAFIDELKYWDGDESGPRGSRFFTSKRHEADIVSALAAITDCGSILRPEARIKERCSQAFVVNIVSATSDRSLGKAPQRVAYAGEVCCLTVPSGFLLVRRNGKPVVAGNCEGEKDADRLWSLGLPATCNTGGAKKWRVGESRALQAAGVERVVLLQDNDAAGREHVIVAAASLEAAGISCVTLPPFLGKSGCDVSDWLDSGHTAADLKALATAPAPTSAVVGPAPDCRDGLSRSSKGIPYPNQFNVVHVLQHDAFYGNDRFWYDEFLDRVLISNSPIREWRDEDDTRITVDMQDRFGIHGASSHTVAESVRFVAHQRTRHIIRDWLTGLEWDQEPRIDTAFEDYWGTVGDDYTKAASRNFFVGLVARILKPGCKLDTMPVFEGPQGIRKSSALQVLGGAWYSVAHESVSSKDFLQGMRGKWLIEIAELQSFTRAEVNAVKTMMSNQVDDYRPSYGRNVVSFPRQCVMAGTTNSEEWGTDDTGLRRFWPIRCGDIDLPLLAAARDQLFAEAVHALTAGQTWWEMPEGTRDVQADRQYHDEWTDTILEWCSQQLDDGISLKAVLVGSLKIDIGRIDKVAQMRASRILKLGGWERKKVRRGNATPSLWFNGENNGEGGNGGNAHF